MTAGMDAKTVADLITLGRVAIAVGLAWLGLSHDPATLPWAVLLLLLDWTGDILDGAVARRSRTHRHTWLGDHDMQVDMLAAAGLLVYLVLTGFLDPRLALIYVLGWASLLWWTHLPRSLGMLCQAPVYAGLLAMALIRQPSAGLWLLLWILAAIVATWPRTMDAVIPGFLAGMRQLRPPRSGPHPKV